MVFLSQVESELFRDIRYINYGELYNIEVPEEAPGVDMSLGPADSKLHDLISGGIRSFRVIGIHNGQASFAEVEGTTRYGYKYKKKYKFS